jgi:hypothetical protein
MARAILSGALGLAPLVGPEVLDRQLEAEERHERIETGRNASCRTSASRRAA